MKMHIVEDGGGVVYSQTVTALFAYHGNSRVKAGKLPDFSDGVGEGWVKHVRLADGVGVNVVNLQSCSALLYCYMAHDSMTDVVAYHSPGGGIHFKRDPEREGNLGTPTEEAKQYGIKGYDRVYVVVANGPKTAAFGRSERLENVNKAVRETLREVLELVASDASVRDDDVLLYDHCDGQFGVSAQGHVGEPGRLLPPVQTGGTAEKEKEGCAKCCYITTATLLALGKGDDCAELAALRAFRDRVLARMPEGPAEIAAYYATAPAIVDAIELRADRGAIYRAIYERDLLPALAAIEAGRCEDAHRIYRAMVERLAALVGDRPDRQSGEGGSP